MVEDIVRLVLLVSPVLDGNEDDLMVEDIIRLVL